MEMNEQVLRSLMEADQQRGIFFSLQPIMERQYPRLPQAKIARIMEKLEEQEFISTSTRKSKGVPQFVRVNPAAYSYFKEREERMARIDFERTRAIGRYLYAEPPERGWHFKSVLAGFVAGIFAGFLLLLWLRAAFFA